MTYTKDLKSLAKEGSLIKKYLEEQEELKPLINTFPSLESFESQINNRKYNSDARSILVHQLRDAYKGISIPPSVVTNIDLLLNPDTFTITTGHQLCLATGPLYFLYKIISCIKLCEQLSLKYPSKNFVPVYWLASEDHDFDEINHFHIYGKKLAWESSKGGAVGELSNEGMLAVLEELKEILGTDEASTRIFQLIQSSYLKQENLSQSMIRLVTSLFGDLGVVSIDGNNHALKSLFAPLMKQEIQEGFSFNAVSRTTSSWSNKPQVSPREINLFYLENGKRNRIVASQNGFEVLNSEKTWDKTSILLEIENQPELFSPNVILRPLYQEAILPNLAYVGGPGELTYWFQLKGMFDSVEVDFPLLIHRDSFLILDKGVQKRMEKLELEMEDLYLPKEDLVKRKIAEKVPDLGFENLKETWESSFDLVLIEAKNVDASLEASFKGEWTKIQKSLDQLVGKTNKFIKKKEEVTVNQIGALKDKLFPNGSPQERHDNFIPYLIANPNLISDLLKEADPLKGKQSVIKQS